MEPRQVAMIIKKRARVQVAKGMVQSYAVYPIGCGGMNDTEPCYAMEIGLHRLIVTASQWESMVAGVDEAKALTAKRGW